MPHEIIVTSQTKPHPPPVFKPVHSPRRFAFTVAGVAGGVGTTTVAAILATALLGRTGIPPRIIDHTGGCLALRVSATNAMDTFVVRDLGAFALNLASENPNPANKTVIVTSPDPNAAETALAMLQHLTSTQTATTGEWQAQAERCLVIVNSTSRRKPPYDVAEKLGSTAPGAAIVTLPWDPALTTPDVIEPAALATTTSAAAAKTLQLFGI